jgi:hypothetical protein
MAQAGIALSFLALSAWVAGLPLPGLDWMTLAALVVGAGLSAQAVRRGQRLGIVGLGSAGFGLVLWLVLSIT